MKEKLNLFEIEKLKAEARVDAGIYLREQFAGYIADVKQRRADKQAIKIENNANVIKIEEVYAKARIDAGMYLRNKLTEKIANMRSRRLAHVPNINTERVNVA